MSAKDVIIALDFPTREETLSFLDQFPAGEKPFVKIGMELFYAEGTQDVYKRQSGFWAHKAISAMRMPPVLPPFWRRAAHQRSSWPI